jgi:hypothetical protein
MTEVQDKLIPVEAHFTGACAGIAMFTLAPINDEDNVVMGVSLDDLIGGKFIPCSIPHLRSTEVTFDETDITVFLRDMLTKLSDVKQELYKLREEYAMTSNTARYHELSGPYGPIRWLEWKRDALVAAYTLTFRAAMGFWPHELRDLGIV